MTRRKPARVPEFREVIYSEEHWNALRQLRSTAIELLKLLERAGFQAFVHGSVARGDVSRDSDVDIFLQYRVNQYSLELALERAGNYIYSKYLVIATPTSTPKAVIYLDPEERISVSYPMLKMKPRELDFFKFSGMLHLGELLANARAPGVNKSLILIIPTPLGHREMPVVGYEEIVSRVLGVDIDVVLERVSVLTRRDEIGRTGIFVKRALGPDESFEEVLRELASRIPMLRDALGEL